MLFSEYFGIRVKPGDDWFDPILDHDTELFVDPFLVHTGSHPMFEPAKRRIEDFFTEVYRLVGRYQRDEQPEDYEQLSTMLELHEVPELCLGYTICSTAGAGMAQGLSRLTASTFLSTPEVAREWPEHFETLKLFCKGIDVDRVSDACANLMKPELAAFTEAVCQRYGVPTEDFVIANGRYDSDDGTWQDMPARLPRNVYADRAILLIPRAFLSVRPEISPEGFQHYLWEARNTELREHLGLTGRFRTRRDIRAFAGNHTSVVADYVRSVREAGAAAPYDLRADPAGVYAWDGATGRYCAEQPPAWTRSEGLERFLRVCGDRFQYFVEERGGVDYLWNQTPRIPRRERAAQLLLAGLVKRYAAAHDISVSRCLETGTTPIDFRSPDGDGIRAWLQVRLLGNTRFWRTVSQLDQGFFDGDRIELAMYMVVVHKDRYFSEPDYVGQLTERRNLLAELERRVTIPILWRVVDATALDLESG